jgi:hypothetical protein
MLVPSQEKQTIALLLVTSVFFLSVPVGAACVVVYKCFCSMYYVIAYGTIALLLVTSVFFLSLWEQPVSLYINVFVACIM